jgi:hypothetical protein
MTLLYDPICAEYGSSVRPEQPARVLRSADHLRSSHPDWSWRKPPAAEEPSLLAAHTSALLKRIQVPPDIDADTP